MAKTPDLNVKIRADLTEALNDGFAQVTLAVELLEIFGAASAEVFRARELHGDQTDRPLGTGPLASYLNDLAQATDEAAPMSALYTVDNEDAANLARQACEDAGDDATWAHIAGEEFFEALAEKDPAKFEVEAIQAIAMLANAIMAARKQAAA